METRNIRSRGPLSSFITYCVRHPEERFWQALRNWSGYQWIVVGNTCDNKEDVEEYNPFYWEGRRHDDDRQESKSPS